MKPAHQTIVLRLAYRPYEQQDPPARWNWPTLLDVVSEDVTGSESVHILTVRPEDAFQPVVECVFSSPDLALKYLTAWMQQYPDSSDVREIVDIMPQLQFRTIKEAEVYAWNKLCLEVNLFTVAIDPTFGQE